MSEHYAADLGDATDPTEISPILLLSLALDECGVVGELLQMRLRGLAHSGAGTSKIGSRMVPGFLRSGSGGDSVDATSAEDFSEALDQARGHWTLGIEHYERLFVYHGHREPVSRLHNELTLAGLFTVLADLHEEAVPVGRKLGSVHLDGILQRIRACNDTGIQARALMIERQERTEQR